MESVEKLYYSKGIKLKSRNPHRDQRVWLWIVVIVVAGIKMVNGIYISGKSGNNLQLSIG